MRWDIICKHKEHIGLGTNIIWMRWDIICKHKKHIGLVLKDLNCSVREMEVDVRHETLLKLLNIFLIPVEWQDKYGIYVTGG